MRHRTGFAPVSVTINGRFGVTYVGSPIRPVPITEPMPPPDEYGWVAPSKPVGATWEDFKIDRLPLFETCQTYVERACSLIKQARALADEIHGVKPLTSPPSQISSD
jgi:hypothetical protein